MTTQTQLAFDATTFSYGLGIDDSRPDSPNEGNPSEIQYYDGGQAKLNAAGAAVLTAQKCKAHLCGDGQTRSVVSGAVHTKGKYTFFPTTAHPVITVDVPVKLPQGAGAWPAIWMRPVSNINTGEIDIVEYIRATFNWHHNTLANGGWQLGSTDYGNGIDLRGYNTFGVAWSLNTLKFRLNGVTRATFTDVDFPGKIPAEPYYLIANLAATKNLVSQQQMLVGPITVTQ
ncbi:glycosyl hydrolase family 16 [Jatrophihabitans sp. GAS493]|uniref:glycoside hydrolase family 16 protein n=1 Tax=Jatrophihabitans sp. GAS493 TaxID=1907575 RepID=UPI000BB9B7B2|nr:family 16 glycosylhydrolase [Jatrophihabitans sp. GAS493]SOD72705.1 glycosyl hydrolase family 16 [Jatrophihabitans sp. GAS493]